MSNKIFITIMSIGILFGNSGCQNVSHANIEPYKKERDREFIEQLVSQYPYEFAETVLFTDLESKAVHAILPNAAGIPAYDVSFSQEIFVYLHKGTPVGFIRLFEFADTDHEIRAEMDSIVSPLMASGKKLRIIEQLGVDKAYQRQGIGQKLLTFALDHLKKQGVEGVALSVMASSAGACKLYEKAHFTRTKEVNEHDTFWGAYYWYALKLSR